jgi:predicted nucleotide-binding protein
MDHSESDYDALADMTVREEEAAKTTENIPIVKFGRALERARARRATRTPAQMSLSIVSAAMPTVKEPERITLAEGLHFLEKHFPTEQAKALLRQAFILKAFSQSPSFALEYDDADIDWTTGSVKIPRMRDRFTPSFRRADFDRYSFKGRMAQPDEIGRNVEARSRKVFVVHGHDEGAREAVARFLEKLEFVPVILHEQSNQGRTIVEKFEAYADVDFAVVLLTPDDVGGPKGGAQQPRARQNVILELGYFIGKLGRQNVCAIKLGDLEIPSDIMGVVWIPFDAHNAWKTALAKELGDAGHAIDSSKVIRP